MSLSTFVSLEANSDYSKQRTLNPKPSHVQSKRMSQAISRNVSLLNTDLDKKLLAHIVGNGLINKTVLEGYFLDLSLKYTSKSIKALLSSDCGIDIPKADIEVLTSLRSMLQEAAHLAEDFYKVIYEIPEDERRQKCSEHSLFLLTSLRSAPEEENILLPGGFINPCPKPDAGSHAMLYELEKDPDGEVYFHIYNTGLGINYHSPILDGNGKLKFLTRMSLKLGKSESILNFAEPLADILYFYCNPPSEDTKIEFFYESLVPQLMAGGATLHRTNTETSWMIPQKSGICTYHVILALQKSRLSAQTYKLLRLYSKVMSLHQMKVNDPALFHPRNAYYSFAAQACDKTRRQLNKAGLDPEILLPHFPTASTDGEKQPPSASLNPKVFFSQITLHNDRILIKSKVKSLIVLYWIQSIGEAFTKAFIDFLMRIALEIQKLYQRIRGSHSNFLVHT